MTVGPVDLVEPPIAATITTAIVPKGDYAKALRALGWRKPATAKPAKVTRERTTGPGRRGPRGRELRNAVIGWSAVSLALIAAWAATGAGFRGSPSSWSPRSSGWAAGPARAAGKRLPGNYPGTPVPGAGPGTA